MVETGAPALNRSRETRANTQSGYLMLFIWLLLLGVAAWAGVTNANAEYMAAWKWVVVVASAVVGLLILCGFYLINPNEAAAIQLFGAYKGTDREEGLRWVLPWLTRKKIAVRANNVISDKIKVNDLRGNPIEMAAQVVWRVTDTAQALFDVDDYKEFVMAQIEAAVRSIGSRYPYDDIEHQEVTLRGNHDEVGVELRKALIERLSVAGITVDECGLTHLAYAQEIAGAMLRRQQAEAVISARKKLVEGAVTMVEMALNLLSEKGVVELDDALFGQQVQRHLDHRHRAFDQLLACRNDRLGLLAAQHRTGDFLCISQMGKAAFVDGDPRNAQPLDQRLAQFDPDLVMVAAQRHFLMLNVVIGVARADRAHRGLDLRHHKFLVIVDVEQGLRGVGDAPHDLRCHLDRVAAQVVDLDLVGNDIVRAHRDLLAGQPWQHPAQPFFAVGALIRAEQLNRRSFVGVDQVKAAEDQ